MLWGGNIQRGRSLSAGQRDVVLAGQIHLPDHLWLQLPIAHAAVAQTFPLPLLGGVAILTNPKPVRRSPEATNMNVSDLLHLLQGKRRYSRRCYSSTFQDIKLCRVAGTSSDMSKSKCTGRDNFTHTKFLLETIIGGWNKIATNKNHLCSSSGGSIFKEKLRRWRNFISICDFQNESSVGFG